MIDEPATDPTYDPILDEVRRAGEEYLAQFDFDLKLAVADLIRRTEAAQLAGRKVVSYPPKRIASDASSAKRAG